MGIIPDPDPQTGTIITPQTQVLDLSGDQQLVLEQESKESVLHIIGRDRKVLLSIQITEAGPVLRFEGVNLAIQTSGDLSIEAERLTMHGRSGLAITSGKDLKVEAAGELHSIARLNQKIIAEIGDVDIRANDDVKMDGERIRMNC